MNTYQILICILLCIIGAFLCGFWTACVICEQRLIAAANKFKLDLEASKAAAIREILAGITEGTDVTMPLNRWPK